MAKLSLLPTPQENDSRVLSFLRENFNRIVDFANLFIEHIHNGTDSSQVSHDTLTGVSADDHHAQSHAHSSHTGIGANDHHNESHNQHLTALGDWWVQDVAASISTPASMQGPGPGGLQNARITMPVAGRIEALSVRAVATRTAGAVRVRIYVNGSEVSTGILIDGTNPEKNYVTDLGLAFNAGDTIQCFYSTSNDWAPTTSDLIATLWGTLDYGAGIP